MTLDSNETAEIMIEAARSDFIDDSETAESKQSEESEDPTQGDGGGSGGSNTGNPSESGLSVENVGLGTGSGDESGDQPASA